METSKKKPAGWGDQGLDQDNLSSSKDQSFGFYDLLLVLLVCARLVTFCFVQWMGTRAVFLHIAVMGALIVIAMVKGIFFDKNRGALVFLAMVLAILLYSLISLQKNPDLRPWLFSKPTGIYSQVFDFRSGGVFFFLALVLIRNPQRIFRDLTLASFLRLAYCIFQIFLYSYTGDWANYFTGTSSRINNLYNMSLGYELVLPALVFLVMALRKKSTAYTILAGFAAGLSIFFGSRGVLVIFAAYILLVLIFELAKTKAWKFYLGKLLIAGIVLVITLLAIPPINAAIYQAANPVDETMSEEEQARQEEILEEMQSSRNLDSISEGELTESNGRLHIWKISWEAFKASPIFGHGMYGDRPFVGQIFQWGYSHNIFFEFLASFGIFGIFYILALAIFVIQALRQGRDNPYYDLFLVFMASSCKLLLSDSFWFHRGFFSLLACLYLYYRSYGVKEVFRKKKSRSKPLMTLDQAGARYDSRPWPGLVVLTLALVFSFGMGLVRQVKAEIQAQDFKPIRVQEPTVVFNLEGEDYAYRLFQDLGKEASSTKFNIYLSGRMVNSSGYLSKPKIREMEAAGWAMEDSTFNYRGLVALGQGDRKDQFLLSNAYFKDIGFPKPQALLLPFGSQNMSTDVQAKRYREVLVRQKGGIGPNQVITEPELASLTSHDILAGRNTIFMDEEDLQAKAEGREKIQKTIDRVGEEGGLLILSTKSSHEDYHYLKSVVDQLVDRGFHFITMEDLLEMGEMKPGQGTFKTWFENTYLAHMALN